jgi:transposase-like protein
MTKTQVEVITSVQRRRRWSRAEKERIVAAALEPGVVASEVAREAGIHTSRLFRWRQQLCKRTPVPAAFNPVAGRRLSAPELLALARDPTALGGALTTSCALIQPLSSVDDFGTCDRLVR